MTTKVKNSDILSLFEAINMLEMSKPNLPVKIFYANSKNRGKLQPLYKDINDSRFKLLDQYGIKDSSNHIGYKLEEDGRTFSFKSDKDREKFSEELAPILEMETDVTFFKIKIDEFEGLEFDRTNFPLIDVYLDWLVE